jgi:uncharacterized protein with von Willebrand factor type A (vWA) domain
MKSDRFAAQACWMSDDEKRLGNDDIVDGKSPKKSENLKKSASNESTIARTSINAHDRLKFLIEASNTDGSLPMSLSKSSAICLLIETAPPMM